MCVCIVYINVCAYVCIHTYVHIYMCVCIYMCVYTYLRHRMCIEAPAGLVGAGEEYAATAFRELFEETGDILCVT